MDRRQFLKGVGIAGAAAVTSQIWGQGVARAASSLPGLRGGGDSMMVGLGLGRTQDPETTWFAQLGRMLGIQYFNDGIAGTNMKSAIAEQEADPDKASWGRIFWTGHKEARNGRPKVIVPRFQTLADYSASRYLILSLTNGVDMGLGTQFHTDILAPGGVNERVGVAHGDSYLDIRTYLVLNGLQHAGLTATAQDQLDVDADIVPSSLRAPQSIGHLNAFGQKVAAEEIYRHMGAVGGWLT